MALPMTYSPKALAQEALLVAQRALSAYSSKYSRKDYTQAQHFALLVLKTFFQTSYRGIIAIVKDFTELQNALGLKSVPCFSALQKAAQRLEKKGLLTWSNRLCVAAPGDATSCRSCPKRSWMPRASRRDTSARTTAGSFPNARKRA